MLTKYAVMHEYVCQCGYRIIMRDNNFGEPDLVKEAGKPEPGHMHTLVQVVEEDNGPGLHQSPSVRPE